MTQRDPSKESYFRSRYLSLASSARRNTRAADNYYDSQDETDALAYGRNGGRLSSYYTSSRNTTTTIVRKTITIITTILSFIVWPVRRIFYRSDRYERIEKADQGD